MTTALQATVATGRFIRHDLVTRDPARACAFYGALVDWTHGVVDAGHRQQEVLEAGGRRVGGIVPLGPRQASPSHWLPWVTVDDVMIAAQHAVQLGGSVAVPPTHILEVGQFAIVGDPHGAFLALVCPDAPVLDGERGICWDELHTPDVDAAAEFYGPLLGWTPDSDGDHTRWMSGERACAGAVPLREGEVQPYWFSYIAVDDVARATAHAVELGAHVYREPALTTLGTSAVLADPTGAAFGLLLRPS